jgi:hypothetical protein
MLKYRLDELYALMRTKTGKRINDIKNDYIPNRYTRNRLENATESDTINMTALQMVRTTEYFGVTQEEVYQPEYLAKLKRSATTELSLLV